MRQDKDNLTNSGMKFTSITNNLVHRNLIPIKISLILEIHSKMLKFYQTILKETEVKMIGYNRWSFSFKINLNCFKERCKRTNKNLSNRCKRCRICIGLHRITKVLQWLRYKVLITLLERTTKYSNQATKVKVWIHKWIHKSKTAAFTFH